jgi:hypothetical protein
MPGLALASDAPFAYLAPVHPVDGINQPAVGRVGLVRWAHVAELADALDSGLIPCKFLAEIRGLKANHNRPRKTTLKSRFWFSTSGRSECPQSSTKSSTTAKRPILGKGRLNFDRPASIIFASRN